MALGTQVSVNVASAHARRLLCAAEVFALVAWSLPVFAASLRTDAAITAMARLFDDHALVMFGERHRNGQQHAFLRTLLRDARFACRLDDVVVEFGNSRLQARADAYAAGEAISEEEFRGLWRDTDVLLAWNSPVYRQFYETVREVNARKLCPHPLRIVLADPPIDWARVRSAEDFARYGDRDGFFLETVEREVLARHHHALMVAGELHALKQYPAAANGDPTDESVASMLERRHPGALFSVVPVPTRASAQRLRIGMAPAFIPLAGSRLAHEPFDPVAPGWSAKLVLVGGRHVWKQEAADRWPPMADVVDGLLYLGGDETALYPPPSIYLEPAYQAELRRRARIIKAWNGQDFMPVIDDLVKDAGQGAPATAPSH